MTSTWIQSAPAASTARTSSPSRAKSAERMDGATSSGRRIAIPPKSADRLTCPAGSGNARVPVALCTPFTTLVPAARRRSFLYSVPESSVRSAGPASFCWERTIMARTDAIVLGAGIVGTSIALHLAKRGLAVALVDKARAGRGDLLRQCRRDRGQYAVSASVSGRIRGAAAGRAQARDRGQLPPLVPAARRALAARSIAPIRRSSAASGSPT